MFNREIFRKKALDKLSSPDDLDELLQVNLKSSWILLVSLLCLILGGLFWGFYGQIVNKVTMTGVILPSDPPVSLIAEVSGQIDSVFHYTGDQLLKDQPICRFIPFNGKEVFWIKSPCDGELMEMNAVTGDFLETGATVAKIGSSQRKHRSQTEFLFFVSENEIDNLAIGQKVDIDIGGQISGYTKISSWITYIGRLPASDASINSIIPDEEVASRLKNGSFYLVRTAYIPLTKEKDPFFGFSVKDWFGKVYYGEAITSQSNPVSYLLSPVKTK